MSAVITDIAALVTTLLNGATLSQSFEAERVYVPSFDVATMGSSIKLFVLALDSSVNLDDGTREENPYRYGVTVAIYRQVSSDADGQTSVTAADAMMQFAEEVGDFLRTNERLSNDARLRVMKN